MTPSGSRGGVVTAAERAALLRKYRILASWRRMRDAAGGGGNGQGDSHAHGNNGDDGDDAPSRRAPAPDREALQALSRDFPGALRELDVLGLPELQRRIDSLSRPAGGDGAGTSGRHGDNDSGDFGDDWIVWIQSYHATMRTALLAKRTAGRARRISMTAVAAILREAEAAGVSVDQTFVRAAAHPPGGRLAVLVLRALAQQFGVPAAVIATTLFPPRRPSPYQL